MQGFLEGKVDLPKLVDQLRFDVDNLERATLNQPKLYLTASRLRAQIMQKSARAKRRYDQLVSEKKLKLRRQNFGKGKGDKLTEGGLTDTVSMSPMVRKARMRLDRLEALEELSKLLVDTFRQRRDTIRNLIEIKSAEMSNEIWAVRRNMEQSKVDKMRRKARRRFSGLGEEDDDE